MEDLKQYMVHESIDDTKTATKYINRFINDLDKFLQECEDGTVNASWALGKILKGLDKKDWDIENAIEYYEK